MIFTNNRYLGLSSFLKDLGLVAEYFDWDIPSQKIVRDIWYIRGYHRNGSIFCPLTAVAFVLKGCQYSTFSWPKAAKALKIPHDLAHTVVKAADGGVAFHAELGDLHEIMLKILEGKREKKRRN